jgi:hypothetical protein
VHDESLKIVVSPVRVRVAPSETAETKPSPGSRLRPGAGP